MSAWAAQLEWLDADGDWVWIARFDTAGGSPHRDCNRIARHEEAELPHDPGQALRVATHNLRTSAEAYTEAYQVAEAAGRDAWS